MNGTRLSQDLLEVNWAEEEHEVGCRKSGIDRHKKRFICQGRKKNQISTLILQYM